MSTNIIDALIAQTKLSKKKTDKQQRIVEAAITLFAEKGYANTSTSEIAKAAGVAEGTIFRHYGTKDNLLLSVILPFFKQSLPSLAEEAFAEIQANKPLHFEDFLRELLKNRIKFFQANREVFQILVKEMIYNEDMRNKIAPLFLENIIRRIGKVVEMYREQGEIIDLPVPTLQRLLMTYFGGYFLSRVLLLPENFIDNEEEEINQVVRVIVDGLGKSK